MNIFFLDHDPVKAASYLVDKHVNKMGLESVQMLCTAHRLLDGMDSYKTVNGRAKRVWTLFDDRDAQLYSAGHYNHPCSVWVRRSWSNYMWLYDHAQAIFDIFAKRGKIHKSASLMLTLGTPPNNIKYEGFTAPALCMPVEFMTLDPVESYREFYRRGKSHLHSWTYNATPEWL